MTNLDRRIEFWNSQIEILGKQSIYRDDLQLIEDEFSRLQKENEELKNQLKSKHHILRTKHYEETCGGCPKSFTFVDIHDKKYEFYLRSGHACLTCLTDDCVLLSEKMPGFDGVCQWQDFVAWAFEHGYAISV